MKLRASGEDYLEAILSLQQKQGDTVRSVDVAAQVGVTKPSVSNATKLLKEGGYITMDGENIIHLTDLGREIAEKTREKRQYFTEQLVASGIDPDTAAKEACRMEHTISDDSFRKLREQEQKACPFADTCDYKPNGERCP